MTRLLLLSTGVLLAAAPAARSADAALLQRLADPSFAERESALATLVEMGDRARPLLDRAAASKNPEVRWRAQAAQRRVRWRVSPALHRRIGDAFAGFENRPWHEQERIVMDVATIGGRDAIPTLARVLEVAEARAAKRAAAVGLLRMGPEGLLALERSGAKFLGLPADSPALRIEIGNGFLEEEKYERALLEYRKAIRLAPKNVIAWYNLACALSRLKRLDEAAEALAKSIEFGYDELAWIKKDPDLDSLRDHATYRDLIRALEEKARRKDAPGADE
jgi:tetratricopeptide (TPR) repeat protein